ncbi:MAG: hypothetical protein H6909_04165 [Rickettsiaceae bacterium]|nr:hypothetical protein [Rickettsiaceae bacterium]
MMTTINLGTQYTQDLIYEQQNGYEQSKDSKDNAKIGKQTEYIDKINNAFDNLSGEIEKIKKDLTFTSEQQAEYAKCKKANIMTEAYFIQEHVEKLNKGNRPDLKLLKKYKNEFIKACDSALLTKVASTLIGIIGSSTQAIMAPIRIALTTTSNIAYTPVGIYKNYQSYKKDDKGNVKNWAKSADTIRKELATLRTEKIHRRLARTLQNINSTKKNKDNIKTY